MVDESWAVLCVVAVCDFQKVITIKLACAGTAHPFTGKESFK